MAIISDVSQILISGASIAHNKHKEKLDENMIRHMFFNHIKSVRHKFIDKYEGPFILAWDGRNYWRKDELPYYKSQRKAGREASPMNWELIFNTMHKLYEEIGDYFPYYSIKVDGAEADDVISVLVDYFSKNEFKSDGMFHDEPQKILINSNDTDFLQLQDYDNVYQYSQMKSKLIATNNAREFLIEKVIRGDRKDGITNMFSSPDTFTIPGMRQKSCKKEVVDDIIKTFINSETLPEYLTEEQKDKFKSNYKMLNLIDLQLPAKLRESIINEYLNTDITTKGKGTVHSYLIKYGMKNFLREINKF